MPWHELARLAWSALGARRGRSALTVLSIAIGAFAIVLMTSLAESGLQTIARDIEELGGARILLVVQKRPERGEAKQNLYPRGITLADRDRLFADIPHVASLTLFSRLGKKEVVADTGARATTSVVASDAGFFEVFRMRVARGRAFTDDENRARQPVCVVGHKLVAKMGAGEVGQFLSVGPMRCRVIGVFADNDRFGTNFGFDWTDLVVVPGESMGDREPLVRMKSGVFLNTDAPSSNDIVKRIVNARFVGRHPGVDDFTLFDLSGAMQKFHVIFAVMEMLVALLAGIALLVGGVGVMNMMLVAVSERVGEIGLRKALGASPRAIGLQFLVESCLLSVAGGGAGIAAGVLTSIGAGALIVRLLPRWQLSLAPGAMLAAIVATLAIGIAFGWLPARRAAQLDPVEAMRR